MKFSLRTLVIFSTLGPPLLALLWFTIRAMAPFIDSEGATWLTALAGMAAVFTIRAFVGFEAKG